MHMRTEHDFLLKTSTFVVTNSVFYNLHVTHGANACRHLQLTFSVYGHDEFAYSRQRLNSFNQCGNINVQSGMSCTNRHGYTSGVLCSCMYRATPATCTYMYSISSFSIHVQHVFMRCFSVLHDFVF